LGAGTIKLLAQAEWRFPIIGSTFGALFVDAGNVWLTAANARSAQWNLMSDPELFKAVAFNPLRLPEQTALGAVLDCATTLIFFIARADWGLQIYDPRRLSIGEAWWTPTQALRRSALQIAIGLPF
jgi:hypothetical protein